MAALWQNDAITLARMLRSREVSAREVIAAHIGRHGLPVAHKDLLDTAGIRTTYGSPLFAEHVPERDALVVSRMSDAGAAVRHRVRPAAARPSGQPRRLATAQCRGRIRGSHRVRQAAPGLPA